MQPSDGDVQFCPEEIVISQGIDNVVFIAILASRLPEEQQAKARTIGLLLAIFYGEAFASGPSATAAPASRGVTAPRPSRSYGHRLASA